MGRLYLTKDLPDLNALTERATAALGVPCPSFGPDTVFALIGRIRDLESALSDLCDGGLHRSHEIHAETGLPTTRCDEIAEIVNEILNRP